MAQGGRGGNTNEILVFVLFSFSSLCPLSAPLVVFRQWEGGKERTADRVKGNRVRKGDRKL
jgi:hypothetical protein